MRMGVLAFVCGCLRVCAWVCVSVEGEVGGSGPASFEVTQEKSGGSFKESVTQETKEKRNNHGKHEGGGCYGDLTAMAAAAP